MYPNFYPIYFYTIFYILFIIFFIFIFSKTEFREESAIERESPIIVKRRDSIHSRSLSVNGLDCLEINREGSMIKNPFQHKSPPFSPIRPRVATIIENARRSPNGVAPTIRVDPSPLPTIAEENEGIYVSMKPAVVLMEKMKENAHSYVDRFIPRNPSRSLPNSPLTTPPTTTTTTRAHAVIPTIQPKTNPAQVNTTTPPPPHAMIPKPTSTQSESTAVIEPTCDTGHTTPLPFARGTLYGRMRVPETEPVNRCKYDTLHSEIIVYFTRCF